MSIDFNQRTAYLREIGRAARKKSTIKGNELGVLSKVVNIYSDGVRLSATIWRPDRATASDRPAILLCHGWGGIRDHLDSDYAPKFAAEGFICLTFDYRSWGDSDGIVLPNDGMPQTYDSMALDNSIVNMNCKVMKKVIDPEWQLCDIQSCLSYLRSLDGVDPKTIGLWGSSMGGGHVISIGGMDQKEEKIKCIVSQLGMMISSDLLNHVGAPNTREMENIDADRAKGTSNQPLAQDPCDMLRDLDGYPNLSKLNKYRPIDYANMISVPTLILEASDEELWDRAKHGEAVYKIIQKKEVPAKYGLLKGTHYDGYATNGSQIEGCSQAIAWFKLHLLG